MTDSATEETLEEVVDEQTMIDSAETMHGDFVKFVVDEMIALPDVWQKISEEGQGEILDRLKKRAQFLIEDAVKHIADNGFQSAIAKVDSVTFKDGAKIVLKAPINGNAAVHDLAESSGETVKVVLCGAEAFTTDQSSMPEADKDQRDLIDEASGD